MGRKIKPSRMAELKATFDMFDRNGDGTISANELESVMKSAGYHPSKNDIQRLMRACDTDGSGVIEFSEFTQIMEEYEEISDEDVLAGFKVFDKNGDGHISKSELRFVISDLGLKITDKNVDDMIAMADKDGDGQVSYNEFVKLLRQK